MLYEGVEGIRGKMEDMQKFFSRGIHCASSADMEHFEILWHKSGSKIGLMKLKMYDL